MKRYSLEVEWRMVGLEEDASGDWVEADIAFELLEALEEFANVCGTAPPIEFIQRIGMAYETAKKVIAKAKGESNGN